MRIAKNLILSIVAAIISTVAFWFSVANSHIVEVALIAWIVMIIATLLLQSNRFDILAYNIVTYIIGIVMFVVVGGKLGIAYRFFYLLNPDYQYGYPSADLSVGFIISFIIFALLLVVAIILSVVITALRRSHAHEQNPNK